MTISEPGNTQRTAADGCSEHKLASSADHSQAEFALIELGRLVDDLNVAHLEGHHLRALSNLTAIRPLIGLLSAMKQEVMSSGPDVDAAGGTYL